MILAVNGVDVEKNGESQVFELVEESPDVVNFTIIPVPTTLTKQSECEDDWVGFFLFFKIYIYIYVIIVLFFCFFLRNDNTFTLLSSLLLLLSHTVLYT